MKSPILALVLLALAQLAAANPMPQAVSATPTAVTAGSPAKPTATSSAGGDIAMSPAAIQCTGAFVAAASDKCVSQLLLDSSALGSVTTPDQLYSGMTTLVNNLCGDTCTATYRNTTSSLIGNCAGVVASEVAKGSNATLPAGTDGIIKNVATELAWFAKDLVCLRDTKNGNKLCSISSIELAKKYKFISAIPTAPATTGAPGATTNTPMGAVSLPSMQSTNAIMAAVLPAFNTTAMKSVPKEELCTACTATSVSQTAIYVKQKLVPVATTFDKAEADKLGAMVDKYVADINAYCGADFVKSSGSLILGTDKPQTTVNAAASTSAGAAGSVPASGLVTLAGAAAALALLA
ncbi:hypothetical protein H9P43_000254 [Blastocladiella emersonii ATCC 22665]|nr:hypothetical protein H9P43_000254 [Blastocladiella emersonii ATCC 22665]